MNSMDQPLTQEAPPLNQEAQRLSRLSLYWLGGLLLAQLLVYGGTHWSMVDTWWRAETFAHGFLIAPISLYLIWTRRAQLNAIPSQPNYWSLLVILGCGFVWLLGRLADVLVIQQLAAVAMIPMVVWAVLGTAKTWAMAFPLAYLVFAVPAGEFLVPPMMEFTADFTVGAVRLTGIPVFREGLYFTLPSGSWSVVEACSGVRYIIASLTLGCLYAYLTYHSYWRRAVFILVALITPIIANGIRAYMIVMIGHLSSMKLAVGVDHLIYGWLFFGLVMFFLFWLGGFWRDEPPVSSQEAPSAATQAIQPKWLPLSAALMVTLVLWPLWALQIQNAKSDFAPLNTPEVADWERGAPWLDNWQPRYVGATQELQAGYQQQEQAVGLYMAHYAQQQQGSELINVVNILVDTKETPWRQIEQSQRAVEAAGHSFSAQEFVLRHERERLLVWRWNMINGVATTNDYYAKALEAWTQLSSEGRSGTAVIIFTPFAEDERVLAQERLGHFAQALLPQIR